MTDLPGAGAASTEVVDADVLVVGSGVAGLTAALEVLARAPGARVVVATKAGLGDGATAWAQGGIAAVVPDPLDPPDPGAGGEQGDAVALHVADTLAAGDGLCAPEAVAVLCAGAADAVAALLGRGLVLDADEHDPRRPARGLEAAHSRRRVLHAGGDVTGAHVAAALGAAARTSGARVLERTGLVDLVLSGAPGARRVSGALLHRLAPAGRAGAAVEVRAGAVVLATGGFGQLYAHTTTPPVATGDGLAAAARAGALVVDVEMVQFHPTLAVGAPRFLVSEAVRGEGAVLRDERGQRFLVDGPLAVPGGELAPRDVVARAIAAAMGGQDGRPVVLDATALVGRWPGGLAQRFPGIDALCRRAGVDWAREPVPVTPAAHYAMGGVGTDTRGRTSLPGLWAVGEVAWTGVHGANRLASNSLLEGAVFAARAAADVVAGGGAVPAAPPDALGGVAAADLSGPALPRAELAELAWQHAGLLRDGPGLEVLGKALHPRGPDAPARAAAAGEGAGPRTWRDVEDANLTAIARLVAAAASARRESRGAHHRTDHPRRADRAQHTVLRASA